MIYQNPQPVLEDLVDRYDQSYFNYEEENQDNFLNLMKLGLADAGFDRWESESRERGPFLDVGCATGSLIGFLKNEKGWQVNGVELCRPSAEYGRKKHGVDIFAGTLEDAAFPDNHFSVIHCSHLIEHLNQPSQYLNEVFRILMPGGRFICVTPNTSGLQCFLFGSEWRSAIADHLCLFDKWSLVRWMKNKRFEIEKTKTWGGLGVGTAPDFIKRPVDKLAKLFGFGDVMLILARKPKTARY